MVLHSTPVNFKYNDTKGGITMIMIGKKEAEYLRKRFSNIEIVRTMKSHSDRHRYYIPSSEKYLKALRGFQMGNGTK